MGNMFEKYSTALSHSPLQFIQFIFAPAWSLLLEIFFIYTVAFHFVGIGFFMYEDGF